MAQSLPRSCPRCGAETNSDQKFCPKCGLNMPKESSARPSSGPASDPGMGPALNPTSNPGARIPNPPSRPVPKRPSAQTTPASLEPVLKPPSRPGLEPLHGALSPSLDSLSEQASLSSNVRPAAQAGFPPLEQPPYSPIPQINARNQWEEQSSIPDTISAVPSPSSADNAIDAMPTQMLPQERAQAQAQPQSWEQAQPYRREQPQSYMQAQTQAQPQARSYEQRQPQPQPYMQTQAQPEPRSLSAAPKPRIRAGRVVILVVLLIVVLGGVGFGIVTLLQKADVASQPTITTAALGTTVNYAGVDITVVNGQKSQSFIDDPSSASDGMLRLQLHAQNKTSLAINLPYETITHVTLPSGKVIGPTYVKANEHLTPDATQTGLVDFAVPENVRLNQLIFHLGSVDEVQLDIPLTGHAIVDQYAPKEVQPNQQISYYNLNWTLTDATLKFHIDGRQASKGMRYLVLTVKVDNPLLETAIPGSPYDYVQLQANNTAITLVDTTLPVSFETGATGKIGTLTFLVPQDATSFTLTLANKADGFAGSNTNATATFHL